MNLPAAESRLEIGQACGEIESTKSVGDLYAPVAGVVAETNAVVVADPSLVNTDPFGAGWLLRIQTDAEPRDAALLSAAEYAELIAQQDA